MFQAGGRHALAISRRFGIRQPIRSITPLTAPSLTRVRPFFPGAQLPFDVDSDSQTHFRTKITFRYYTTDEADPLKAERDNMKAQFKREREERRRKLEEEQALNGEAVTETAKTEADQARPQAEEKDTQQMKAEREDPASSNEKSNPEEPASTDEEGEKKGETAAKKGWSLPKFELPSFNVKKFLFDAREVAKEIVREADKADDVDLPNKQDVLTTKRRRVTRVEADASAGTAIQVRKKTVWETQWESMTERAKKSKIFTRLARMRGTTDTQKKDSPVMDALSNFSGSMKDRMSDWSEGFMGETDTAVAIRELKAEDPSFDVDNLLFDLKRGLLPVLIKAVLEGDQEVLEEICSEGCFHQINSHLQARQQDGLTLEANLLALTDLQLHEGKIVEHRPILVLVFRTQQTYIVRDREGLIVEGGPGVIQNNTYIGAVGRNAETREWQIEEVLVAHQSEAIF